MDIIKSCQQGSVLSAITHAKSVLGHQHHARLVTREHLGLYQMEHVPA